MFISADIIDWKDSLFSIFPTFLFLPDLDECESGDEMCDDICINTIGSYRCECNEGRSLDNDRRGCSGMNRQEN